MTDIEVLDWKGLSPFYFDGLVRKKEISDGSCFFHCIADSFNKPYQLGTVDKKQFARQLRKDLANNLKIDVYNKLSRGGLREFSKKVPGFSYEDMKKTLDSNSFVDNRFNEYISNVINKDIYILDYENKNVYITGIDDDILYKNRDSIVLIWINNNHFDLVGILDNKRLTTMFDPKHPFIETIKRNMLLKRSKLV